MAITKNTEFKTEYNKTR